MQSYDIEKQKPAVQVFIELQETTVSIDKQVMQAGWIQRSALITHVYSNYNNHEDLMNKKNEWEQLGFQYRVHAGLLKIMTEFRDLYGYFPDYTKMIYEIDALIETAVSIEDFEIAAILKIWRDKLPDP